jgi:hypothetical protein
MTVATPNRALEEPAMPLSHLPPRLTSAFARLGACLDRRSALRVPVLLFGILFARGRRTCTSWFRAAGISDDFRPAYNTIWAIGKRAERVAVGLLPALPPLLRGQRLWAALDDTPTSRWGPCIEGAGIHHNPNPGPAGEKYVYGHVWVTLAALAKHPTRGTLALPLRNELYVRAVTIAAMDADHRVPFRTKLELAAQEVHWLCLWCNPDAAEIWLAVDGGYAKRPFLRAVQQEAKKVVVISRLPKNAALFSLPEEPPPGRRGRKPIYGKERFKLHLRAGQTRGWQQVECVQYGKPVTKTIKTFLATWRPAGGVIRVVLVKEEDRWLPYFSTEPTATAEEILEGMADRGALEQTNKDVKEVWGAAQQQVRNRNANVGCFNLDGWMYSLVEAWAWDQPDEELVDRSDSPWDHEPRRPSHQDKRKALQREVLRGEIDEALAGEPDREQIRALAERLLWLAA